MRVAVLKCLFDGRPDEVGNSGGHGVVEGFAVSREDELIFVKVFQACFGCVGNQGYWIILTSVDPVRATLLSVYCNGNGKQSE